MAATKGRLSRVQTGFTNLKAFVLEAKDKRVRRDLEMDLVKLYDERESLERDKSAFAKQINELSKANETAGQQLVDVEELLLALKHSEEPYLIELRLKLREQLKKLIDLIKLYPMQVQEVELVYRSGKSVFLERDRWERYRMNVRSKFKVLK